MKVKELIEKLKEMPQDAEVFGYGSCEGADHAIEEIGICTKREDCPHPYQMNGYHCRGDSWAAYYLTQHPEDKEVVVLK